VYLIVTLLNGKQPFNAYTSSFRLDIKCINLTLVKQEKVAIGVAHLLPIENVLIEENMFEISKKYRKNNPGLININ
jgi:hypothetical protein